LGNCRAADEAFRTGSYEKAIGLYFEYLEDFPEDLRAWVNLGISFGRIDKPADALKCFERALDIGPQSHEAWLNRGQSLLTLGRPLEALECFEMVLRIHPGYQLAILKKVEVLRLLGREDEATALFREYANRRKIELNQIAGPE
jgi:tetratricopeptide (TPR) repeat protein